VTRTWKLTLEYDGTRYSGWQEQINARTVAGEGSARRPRISCKAEVDLHGSGRTDAGVHALAQVAHLRAKLRNAPGPEDIRRALNSDLPADISVLRVDPARNDFHARHDALSRSYIYQISTRKRAFEKRYVWWVKERLDVDAMQAAAAMLAGRHDFTCFRAPIRRSRTNPRSSWWTPQVFGWTPTWSCSGLKLRISYGAWCGESWECW
jgi:tRNA pseudouridine38-40 synthase